MKFLADMGISQSTILWLIAEGFDAVHVRDMGMHKAADAEIVQKAIEQQRIVLTCDLDFGDIVASSGDQSPSVVIMRLENETPANVNKRLKQVLEESSRNLKEGAIISVEESRHRIRSLPL